jgi:hypothetical protein
VIDNKCGNISGELILKKQIGILDLPFHTLLLSVYPLLYLYARNSVFIPGNEIVRSLIISLGAGIFFLACFSLILRNWGKAGLLVSLLTTLFFSFGHAFNQLESAFPVIQKQLSSITWLLGVWLALFLVGSFAIIRIKNHNHLTQFVNIISITLIAFPLANIISTTITTNPGSLNREREYLEEIRQQAKAEESLYELKEHQKPDIYFIIFDAYERADKLQDLYGFDNSAFITALENRGFHVAEESRSNYLNTTYSLNTAMNLVYFSDFPTNLQRNAKLNLQTNYVSEFLRAQGYKIVVFDSGTGDSNNQYADNFITPDSIQEGKKPLLNPFETLAIRTTLGLVFLKGGEMRSENDGMDDVMAATVNRELDIRRSRVYSAFTHLPDYANSPEPHLLFAHIYLPHIPFLFGANGQELTYQKNMNFYWYEPSPENFIEQYLFQVEYLNSAILPVIDRIKADSTRPYVIILQSDHGDEKFLDWDNPTREGVDARSATLNAILFSDGYTDDLYPTRTTVNTFRLVFNHWFGTRYPLLPDKVYFHNHPLTQSPGEIPQFTEACLTFNICLTDRSAIAD